MGIGASLEEPYLQGTAAGEVLPVEGKEALFGKQSPGVLVRKPLVVEAAHPPGDVGDPHLHRRFGDLDPTEAEGISLKRPEGEPTQKGDHRQSH